MSIWSGFNVLIAGILLESHPEISRDPEPDKVS